MSTRDYIPTTDAGLLNWSAHFCELISAAPTSYGLTTSNATQLASLQAAYATSYSAAINPDTRGKSTVFAKRQARVNLTAYVRVLARQIQGMSTVTDQQRLDLGLPVHDVVPSPIPAPGVCPSILIVSTVVRTVKIRIQNPADPTSRARPAGCQGVSIFSYVGETAPTDPAQYRFEGSTSRNVVDVVFADTVAAGAKVWLCAFYYNAKGESGFACSPVGINIPGGSALAA
jgi:hypothetical protein